jgi:S1-C subfamily serine protease
MKLNDVIDEIRGTVVQITYTITGLPHELLVELGADGAVFSRPSGSGFFISDAGHVITANQVIDEIKEFAIDYPEGNHFIGVGLPFPNEERKGVGLRGTFRSIKFEVLDTDERNDLALLRPVDNPFAMPPQKRRSSRGQALEPSVAVLDESRPHEGVPVAISGFPLDQAALVTTAGHLASAWLVDIKGQLIPDGMGNYKPSDIADRYLADVQTNSGNSGAPAYLIESGHVIGVLKGALTTTVVGNDELRTSANLAELVPARYVAELAVRNQVVVRHPANPPLASFRFTGT